MIDNNLNSKIDENEEINLVYLLNIFLRNKVLIGALAFLFLILSYLFSLTRKKIWEGEFEIVLDNSSPQNISSSILNNQNLQRLIGFNTSNTNLSTEIGILESPLVLMPIFEFIKEENKKKSILFSSWREENLSVKLKEGTSILNVSYKDSNKKIIIPVLNKISTAYQQYSGKNKKKSFKLAKDYLNFQINKYKLKSSQSFRTAQEYAMDQDLTILGGQNQRLDLNFNNLASNIGIEGKRVSAANQIRNIDSQIEKILELDDDIKKLQYIGSTIPGLREEGLPAKLKEIEQKLMETRLIYTDNDLKVLSLQDKRDLYVKLLKERALEYLKAQRLSVEATMESAIRPKGVVLKYKGLMREAARDENTLIQLENQFRTLLLEEARIEEPWELITNPTLNQYPVAPRKLRISFLGMIMGLVFGFIFSIFKERKSGYVFEPSYLENLFKTKILQDIKINQLKIDEENKVIFFKELLNLAPDKNIGILVANNIDDNLLNKFKNLIPKGQYKFSFCNDLTNLDPNKKTIMIINLESLKRSEIINISNRVSILKINLFGIVLLSN